MWGPWWMPKWMALVEGNYKTEYVFEAFVPSVDERMRVGQAQIRHLMNAIERKQEEAAYRPRSGSHARKTAQPSMANKAQRTKTEAALVKVLRDLAQKGYALDLAAFKKKIRSSFPFKHGTVIWKDPGYATRWGLDKIVRMADSTPLLTYEVAKKTVSILYPPTAIPIEIAERVEAQLANDNIPGLVVTRGSSGLTGDCTGLPGGSGGGLFGSDPVSRALTEATGQVLPSGVSADDVLKFLGGHMSEPERSRFIEKAAPWIAAALLAAALSPEDDNTNQTGATGSTDGGAPKKGGQLRDPKTGRFVSDPANPPSPYKMTDAQRRAAWKRLAEDPNSGLSAAERAQIKARGNRAPQRVNEYGELETMELSHEPTPLRARGTEVVPRWPKDHAAVDPDRRLKKR